MSVKPTPDVIPTPSLPSTLAGALSAWWPAEELEPGPGCGPGRRWWTPRRLVQALILMAWGPGSQGLVERFGLARQALEPQRQPLWASTYQGFIRAWGRLGLGPAYAAAAYLRQQIQSQAGQAWRSGSWCVLAVDGSRFELPRTAEHQRVFGSANKPRSSPQLWITTLWHLGLGLPWAWTVGRADASERQHLLQMLALCPTQSLLVADAGFSGYELLQAILDSGQHFLIRVGRQVSLLTHLGYAQLQANGTVYLWPSYAQRQSQAPLVLRLIRLPRSDDGRKRMYLLTSVTDPAALSDALAGALYRQRWGVELMYRSLKQTLEARKLRAQSPLAALLEIQGLLLGLTLLGLWQRQALTQASAGAASQRASVAKGLKVLRQGLRRPEQERHWQRELAQAVQDSYRRRRKTRVLWPRKKAAARPPGRPRLRRARVAEVRAAAQLAARLVA